MQRKIMKKLMLVVAMIVLCVAVGMTASALDASGQCGDNGYWTFNETTGELVISGEGDMCDEADLGFDEGHIKSLVIKEGVTSIGSYAFSECFELTDVSISDTVTFIGQWAFSGCINLKEIYLPDSITEMENCIFYYCINLQDVKLPKELVGIRDCVFCHCFRLKSITIPESVMFIDDMAFANCFYLEKVVINNSESKFGESIFVSEYTSKGVLSTNEWIEKTIALVEYMIINPNDEEKLLELEAELLKYTILEPSTLSYVSIFCHDDDIEYSAEEYAVEHNIAFEYCHFYEGDWTYDYENGIKYRKCIHCDEKETEALESETPDEPTVPDEPVIPDEPITPDEPQVEVKESLFSKILGLLESLLDLIVSWFNR